MKNKKRKISAKGQYGCPIVLKGGVGAKIRLKTAKKSHIINIM